MPRGNLSKIMTMQKHRERKDKDSLCVLNYESEIIKKALMEIACNDDKSSIVARRALNLIATKKS